MEATPIGEQKTVVPSPSYESHYQENYLPLVYVVTRVSLTAAGVFFDTGITYDRGICCDTGIIDGRWYLLCHMYN